MMSDSKVKISALAIVFNEEHNIRDYLNNMAFADEIIVVDSFSTDATPDIIRNEFPHVRFYQRAFDDFSSQRNYTLDFASNDWILFFDADERVTQEGVKEIINVINSRPEEAAFWVKRIFFYEGKPLVNNRFNEDRTARIFRRSKCRYATDKLVHEKLVINGKSRVLKYAIQHYSFKDKEDFLNKRLQYSRLKAKELHLKGVKPNFFHYSIRPGFRFFKYYILKFGFFNGRRGYDIARILGHHVYMRYVYLTEMIAENQCKKILVIQQKMIGDVLASSIICNTIKENCPCCNLHYLINPFTFPVIENNPNIDKVVFFEERYRENKFDFIKFLIKIRKSRYDAVIDAYGKWESAFITYFSGASVKISYKKWYTSFLYNRTIEPDKNVKGSALYHRMQLTEAYTRKKHSIIYPKIYLKEEEITEAKNLINKQLDPEKPIIMLSVLGSDEIKSLPVAEMAKVIDVIATNTNAQLLFNYLPFQNEKAREIYSLCSAETQKKVFIDFYTGSLRQFMAVLSQCNALIGNEGGAVNIAKALNIPTFTIFSPWINKKSWNMLTDENLHMAVHLQDYFPEIYGNKHPKEFKKHSRELYTRLKLTLFKDKLVQFLQQVNNKKITA